MNYTVHQVPEAFDRVLRERAAAEHKSVDEVLLDALQRGLGIENPPNKK